MASSSSSCQECARLLQKVLTEADSRPIKLLEALGCREMSTNGNGVTLKMTTPNPRQPQEEPLRRWTRSRLLSQQTQLATSARDTRQGMESLRVECRPCSNEGPEGGARAFVMGPKPLSVVLCSNRLSNKDEMEQVLVHELVHVYDVRVQKLDLRVCENLAYSEVRAATQAECAGAWLAPSFCIHHKALAATSNIFSLPQANACLQKVFSKAVQDTAPFPKKMKRQMSGVHHSDK